MTHLKESYLLFLPSNPKFSLFITMLHQLPFMTYNSVGNNRASLLELLRWTCVTRRFLFSGTDRWGVSGYPA
jgi:hypothetical protein